MTEQCLFCTIYTCICALRACALDILEIIYINIIMFISFSFVGDVDGMLVLCGGLSCTFDVVGALVSNGGGGGGISTLSSLLLSARAEN